VQQIKGSVLKTRMALAEEIGGKDGVQRVIAALSEDDRRALGMILTVQWYPFELGRRLDDAVVQVLGDGRPDFFLRLGEASAEKNLSSIHRGFLSPGDAHAFLAKAPTIYRLYYETGKREYARIGEREGVMTTFDAETFSEPDCLTIVGWHRRALELNGARNPKVVEEECRARGGAVCRYRMTWD